MIPAFLLYILAGVSYKKRPIAKLRYLQDQDIPSFGCSPSSQPLWLSPARWIPNQILPLSCLEESEKKSPPIQDIWLTIPSPNGEENYLHDEAWRAVIVNNVIMSQIHAKLQVFSYVTTLWSICYGLFIFFLWPLQLINYLIWETIDSYCLWLLLLLLLLLLAYWIFWRLFPGLKIFFILVDTVH